MENTIDLTNTSRLEDWFLDAEEHTIDARAEAERARDYYDGIQLTATEIETLKKRGQPPVVINRIRRKIEWLKGLEVKQRSDPKAFPRQPNHEADAEVVTDSIRYVCDNVKFDTVRSRFYSDFLVEGYGGVEILHKPLKEGDVEITVTRYPWDRLFYDPISRESDFSDARYLGAVIWMDVDDFKNEYGDAARHVDALADTQRAGSVNSDTFDDRPHSNWIDFKRDRIRLVLMWYREKGMWKYSKFIRGATIDKGESPYVDDKGESICPLVFQSAFCARDNTRYGVIRDMFDPQDEINKRRSKALHSINSRQTMSVEGAIKSVADMKAELAKPDGHVEFSTEALEAAAAVGLRPFELIPTGDQTSGQLNLLQEAKQEIDLMGANSALAGQTGNRTSGRAVLARQQGGMIELASLNDEIDQFDRRVYTQIWHLIRQFWTEEKWIRVTDSEQGTKYVQLNRPVSLGEKLSELDEGRAVQLAQGLGINSLDDPRLANPVAVENQVSEIDVDIIIEAAPDQVTLQNETFEALMKYGTALPPHILIEADPTISPKKKRQLLKMLQTPPPPNPMEELAIEREKAEIGEKHAITEERTSKAAKLKAETMFDVGNQFN